MASKKIFGLILVFYFVWQAEAFVNCTAIGFEGRFADLDDPNCRNYTQCIYYPFTGGYFLSHNYVCPSTSRFNPSTKKCTANYTCQNITTTTTTSTTTTTTTTSTTTPAPQACTEDGFVPDPSSKNRSSFIECVDLGGTFIETTYSCDEGMFFNPNTTLCDSSYVCPEDVQKFSCSSVGRFPDPTDVTCQYYHMCVVANNGSYAQYDYKCPSTSLFSVIIKKCTANYQCTKS